MSPHAALTRMPFAEHLGIEVEHAADGEAIGRIPLESHHSSNSATAVAHGGVTSALADTVGAAAVMSESGAVTPTIDMRIDYLAPATEDIRAEAEALRIGNSLGVARVELYAEDGEETHVATAHCTYKTDTDDAGESPWTEGEGVYR
ncbi:MAG: PaaI family thioesterase [Haloarculaceae archaeon]